MSDTQADSRAGTPSLVPLKRNFEDEHAPSISSPLNPDAAARPRPVKAREQREKKDSLKKRESVSSARGNTPDAISKKRKVEETRPTAPSPTRYNHELPKSQTHYTVRDFPLVSREPEPMLTPDGVELKKTHDSIENKKIYRYTNCVADPTFSHMRYYRPSEAAPYGARMSLEDSDRCFFFDDSLTIMTNERGWRMGRANVCAREGTFYYEVKIVRGVRPEGSPVPADSQGPLPHVRVGWARREAPLDSPVGFDGYSYGLTDIRMDPMHKSRSSKFLDDGSERAQSKKGSKTKGSKMKPAPAQGFTADDHAREGDVIGLEISLPSIALHRKIVDGNYNPAVDVGSGLDEPVAVSAGKMIDPEDGLPNIVRERFPINYRNAMFFESYDYARSKAMEAYGDRGPHSRETPSPNHADPTVRCLPHSHIKVYKNGRKIGTAFRNLMAFLPPASQPSLQEKNARTGCDDGMCGYFPAVSAFAGGVCQVNFGPDFWCPPAELAGAMDTRTGETIRSEDGEDIKMEEDVAIAAGLADEDAEEKAVLLGKSAPMSRMRGIGERFKEQIAEDIWYDLVDEVDFYVQDGAEE